MRTTGVTVRISMVSLFCLVVAVWSCESLKREGVPRTLGAVRQQLVRPAHDQEQLRTGTYTGCVSVPAQTPMGFAFTGEPCSLTVHPNARVSLSFFGTTRIRVVSTSTAGHATDMFIGTVRDDDVLIVQHDHGRVVSATHTRTDAQGTVVYGGHGDGTYLRECLMGMARRQHGCARSR